MKKQFIPLFCLFHFFAILWWALPQSFGDFITNNKHPHSSALETSMLQQLKLDQFPAVQAFLQRYIDITASQQYWDFFAPHSSRYHQYLSVCNGIVRYGQEITRCQGRPLFSNLEDNFQRFETFGSHRSRLYRLTENLGKLEDKHLLAAFAEYYHQQHDLNIGGNTQATVVLHQFELHPELPGLPKYGYRSDYVLWDGEQ